MQGHIQKKHFHCHLQQYNSLLHPNHYQMPWLLHHTMLMPFGVLHFLATSFGAAFWPFADISLTLDTFGGEATCSSPDVVAVSSSNHAHFVVFSLTTSFGAAFWPFVDISLTLDTFGGEATCSSHDVVAVSSANNAHFVAF